MKKAKHIRLRDRTLFEAAAKIIRGEEFYRFFTAGTLDLGERFEPHRYRKTVRVARTRTDSKALECVCDHLIQLYCQGMAKSLSPDEHKEHLKRLDEIGDDHTIEDVISSFQRITAERREREWSQRRASMTANEFRDFRKMHLDHIRKLTDTAESEDD